MVTEDVQIDLEPVEIKCKFCKSPNIVKNGRRKSVQNWICKDCGHAFVNNRALPGMQYPLEVVAKALEDFYQGMPRDQICKEITELLSFSPSEATVAQWIDKFTQIALKSVKDDRPQAGDIWVFDETMFYLNWRRYWLIDLLDADTSFLLGTILDPSRNIEDISSLVLAACEKCGKMPQKIINPGWLGYVSGVKAAVAATGHKYTNKPRVETNSLHFMLQFKPDLNDRLAVVRQLKRLKVAGLIKDGWRFYYNYFKSQEILDNRVPAEKAGIILPYKSWRDVLNSRIPFR